MSELIILELAQDKTNEINNNGDYKVNLSKEIKIEAGDEIGIKNAFVDTTAITTSNIVIEEDIELNIENGFYLTNWENQTEHTPTSGGSAVKDKVYYQDSAEPIKGLVDGEDYVAMTFKPQSNDMIILDFLRFFYGGSGRTWGDFTCTFQYEDIDGNIKQFHANVAKQRKGEGKVQLISKKIKIKKGTLKDLTPATTYTNNNTQVLNVNNSGNILNDNKQYNVLYETITGGNGHLEPIIKKSKITLPKGNYEPSQLSNFLSEEFSKNDISNTNEILNSNFLLNHIDIRPSSADFAASHRLCFINGDNTRAFGFVFDNEYNTSTGRGIHGHLVGTNQIQFTYNTTYNKFEIDFLHMPMYDAVKGENISVRYYNKTALTGSPVGSFAASKAGGIFFTSLSATVISTGKAYDFWEKELGFDLNNLCVSFSTSSTTRSIGFLANFYPEQFNLINGKNVTTGFSGLDSAIIKAADPAAAGNNSWYLYDSSLPLISTINDTKSIIADNAFNTSQLNGSHYLLEVQSNFTTSLINQDLMTNKIFGIVNRYYGYQSFTSSGSEASIPYIHKGDPVYLKSFKVRILSPDYTLPDNLGDRNTIFIQVAKQQQQIKK